MTDDVDDAADDTPVIHTGSTVRTGKEEFDTFQLAFKKIIKHGMLETSVPPAYPVFLPLKITSPAPSIIRMENLVSETAPVYFPGRDFPTQSPAGDCKEVPATCTDSSVCWQRLLFGLPLSGCLTG